ncbi:hypothetical protein Tco_0635294 [Tanacetum coccineum]
MSSSTVTYTSVNFDFEPWRFQWVSDEELEALEKALQSPGQAPLSLNNVPEPEYPEYLVPSDTKEPIEDQSLPDDVSPTTLSPGYVADSDPEEDPEEDPAEYLADRGDDDDDDEDDDDDDDEDDEDDEEDEEKEEHLAPIDSTTLPVVDLVSSAKDTEAFETDKSAPTPPSPRSRRARIFVRPQTPMSVAVEALIAEYASAPTPPSPPPSPLTPLTPLSSLLPQIPSPPLPLPSPPTHTSPTYAEAPLGYKAAKIQLRGASPSIHHPSEIPSPPLLLPSTTHRDNRPEVDMPLQKRDCFTAPTGRFEVGESSLAAATWQAGHTLAHTTDYGFIDTMDASIHATKIRAMTAVGVVSERVTNLVTTQRQETHELWVRYEDAQDDRALLRA